MERAILEVHVAYQRQAPLALNNQQFIFVVDNRIVQLHWQLFNAVRHDPHVLKINENCPS